MNIFNNLHTPVNGESSKRRYDRTTFEQVVYTRNVETLQHLILLAVLKSFYFYRSMKRRLCPVLRDNRSFRPDFERPDFNHIYSFTAQFWESLSRAGIGKDMSISADLIDLIFAKKVEANQIMAEDAVPILKWLREDIKTIDIDPEILRTLPDNPMVATWLEQRAIDYEQRRISQALGRPATILDWKDSMKAIEHSAAPSSARKACELKADPADELIGPGRYLCRKGGMLLVAQTGIGKSVWAAQVAISFSYGRGCFGMLPTKPLKVLMIQAENDDGDLEAFREGVFHYLKLTEAELSQVRDNFLVVTETARTGETFLTEVVAPNLERHQPDLLIIDPALSFLGGEAASQKDVGGFLRNGLSPLLTEHNCAVILVSHTPRPTTDRDKWEGSDFSYAVFGSVEWVNWARAAMVLRKTKAPGSFELLATKRGGRLKWSDSAGKPTFSKFLVHSREPDRFYWAEGSDPAIGVDDGVWELLAINGPKTTDWERACKIKLEVARATFYRAVKRLAENKRIAQTPDQAGWVQVKPGLKDETGGGHFKPAQSHF